MEDPPPCHTGHPDAPEPLLTTEALVALAHAHRQGIPYETSDQLLERLPQRLRALADLILGGKMDAGEVAYAVAALLDMIEHTPALNGTRPMTTALPPIQPCADLPTIRALLAAAGLPVADLAATPPADFWGCREGTALIGVIGLEPYGSVALLRSLAVAPAWQGRGLGSALLAHAERAARQRGIAALYLLTTTAAAFFARRGYVRLPREAAPPVLQQTAEFAALCPASAACLTKALDAPPA